MGLKMDGVRAISERGRSILFPIIAKIVYFAFTITLAMMLFYRGEEVIGIALYAKEVVEFIMLILYLMRRRKR